MPPSDPTRPGRPLVSLHIVGYALVRSFFDDRRHRLDLRRRIAAWQGDRERPP